MRRPVRVFFEKALEGWGLVSRSRALAVGRGPAVAARPARLLAALLGLAVVAGGVAVAQRGPGPHRAVGAPADDYPEGEACLSGIAIRTIFGAVCTAECASDADCTIPSWGCKRVPQGNGERVGLCIPRRVVPGLTP